MFSSKKSSFDTLKKALHTVPHSQGPQSEQYWEALMEEMGSLEQEPYLLEKPDQPCYLPYRPSNHPDETASSTPSPVQSVVHLPPEIILHILSYIPRRPSTQSTFYSCCLLSRQWYAVAVHRLYHTPYITGKNFKQFVATICPSVNAHVRKSDLAELVRRLDMGNLVHDGSKSVTARLLGRVKPMLEEFVAPQASFAVNCLAALSKCTNLRHLDLSLISESLPLHDLLHAIAPLKYLTSLRFPRSSSAHAPKRTTSPSHVWPPNLQTLHLSGGLHDTSLPLFTTSPLTNLTHLTIEHCPNLSRHFIWHLLPTLSEHLTHLRISYHMPQLHHTSLDGLLSLVPNLHVLSIAADYISGLFFTLAGDFSPTHPLETLELDDSGSADLALEEFKVTATCVLLAVLDGWLGRLRRVRVHKRLGWLATAQEREDVEDLNDLLEAKAKEDVDGSMLGGGSVASASEAGVWVFE